MYDEANIIFVDEVGFNGYLIRFYDFHLSIDPGHNVNSQFTFTPNTESDQKVGQKHQKVSIMYDTPHISSLSLISGRYCDQPNFWSTKL